jgi:uncharacterized protein (DUF924 family)
MIDPRAQALLEAWFGKPGETGFDTPQKWWFTAIPEVDKEMRERFGVDQRRAAAGEYESWSAEADACLALVLLLDQLPRNLYRGSPRAFAIDADARRIAGLALQRGHDQAVAPVRRQFFYLPFEHSEALADQERSVALGKALPELPFKANFVDYAERHRAIIARFGRFPHRNRVLGRTSTAAEEQFLSEPGSSF